MNTLIILSLAISIINYLSVFALPQSSLLPTAGKPATAGRAAGTLGPLDVGTVGSVGTVGTVPGNPNVPPVPPLPPDPNAVWMSEEGVTVATDASGKEYLVKVTNSVNSNIPQPTGTSLTDSSVVSSASSIQTSHSSSSPTQTHVSTSSDTGIPTPTPSSGQSVQQIDSNNSGKFSNGEIIGIAIGALAGQILLLFGGRKLHKIYKEKKMDDDEGDEAGSIKSDQIDRWKIHPGSEIVAIGAGAAITGAVVAQKSLHSNQTENNDDDLYPIVSTQQMHEEPSRHYMDERTVEEEQFSGDPVDEANLLNDEDESRSVNTYSERNSLSPSMAAVAATIVGGVKEKTRIRPSSRRSFDAMKQSMNRRTSLSALKEMSENSTEMDDNYQNKDYSDSEVTLKENPSHVILSSPEDLSTPSFSPQTKNNLKHKSTDQADIYSYADAAAAKPESSENIANMIGFVVPPPPITSPPLELMRQKPMANLYVDHEEYEDEFQEDDHIVKSPQSIRRGSDESMKRALSIRSQVSAKAFMTNENEDYNDEEDEEMELYDVDQVRKNSDASKSSSLKRALADSSPFPSELLKHVKLDDEHEIYEEDDDEGDNEGEYGNDSPRSTVLTSRTLSSPPVNDALPPHPLQKDSLSKSDSQSIRSNNSATRLEVPAIWEEPEQLSDDDRKKLKLPLLKDEDYISYLKGLMESDIDGVSMKSHDSKLSN